VNCRESHCWRVRDGALIRMTVTDPPSLSRNFQVPASRAGNAPAPWWILESSSIQGHCHDASSSACHNCLDHSGDGRAHRADRLGADHDHDHDDAHDNTCA
jgi:hypothetical protein